MKSDIEIARTIPPIRIHEIADKAVLLVTKE